MFQADGSWKVRVSLNERTPMRITMEGVASR